MAEQIKHFEILRKPLVTEKTMKLFQEENKVVLEVDLKATRSDVKRAFEAVYPGTKVEKVNIVVSNPRTKRKGKTVAKYGRKKKAIIKLSKDSKVDIYGIDYE